MLRASVSFVICFAVNLLPVVQGIGAIYGPGLAFELQYYVDALFALGIAIGIVNSHWLVDRSFARRGSPTSLAPAAACHECL